MPRIARKNILSNFIHVMIQGINKEFIFKDDFEIKMYLKYLKEDINDTNLKIISYCMMNNHAHFLFYFKDINEVSKIMSKVNTKYAIFYNKKNNRCGVLFRNRYKLEEIIDQLYLENCIKYIHNNPVKAGMCKNARDYKYSSYNEYNSNNKIMLDYNFITKFIKKFHINIDNIMNEYNSIDNNCFIEYEDSQEKEKLKYKVLKEYMKKNKINNLNEFKDNKKFLNEIVNIFYYKYKLKKQEISEILSVNRLKIYRVINEMEGLPKKNIKKSS